MMCLKETYITFHFHYQIMYT